MSDLKDKRAERRRIDVDKMMEGAKNYAAWDRSDPFTAARCAAHIRSGAASLYRYANKEYGIDDQSMAYYQAHVQSETRRVTTTRGVEEVVSIVYRNITRP